MVVDLLHAVEVIGKLHHVFPRPRTEDSARQIALLATQIQWWDWVRADITDVRRREAPVEYDAPTERRVAKYEV